MYLSPLYDQASALLILSQGTRVKFFARLTTDNILLRPSSAIIEFEKLLERSWERIQS